MTEIEKYLNNAPKWQQEMRNLRDIALNCGLKEELKWNKPCYTLHGKNIILIQGFKKYCALLFFKGYLMDDPKGILVKTGEKTRIGRQIRFNSIQEINDMEDTLKMYIHEAIQIERTESIKEFI